MRGGARAHAHVDRTVTAVAPRPSAPAGASLFDALPTPLFLVDGNNLLWRAAYSPRAPFAANDGRDLTPVFRFLSKLRRALGTYGLFSECVVCFDGADAWAERVELDASYKSNRNYDGVDLSFMGWLPEIRAALECAGIANLEVPDREADDVIATLTAQAGDRPVRILSTDRDYYQLIGPSTFVVNTRSRPAIVDEAELVARHGVTAAQWCDVRALAGDPSDGIPGLPGVGMVRAAALLAGGKTLDDVRASIEDRWEDVARWRELIRLRTDVPLAFTSTGRPSPRPPSPSALCQALGLVH